VGFRRDLRATAQHGGALRGPGSLKEEAKPKLVHGHYDIRTNVEFIGDITGSGHVNVNAGIAAVIPAQKIRDTLMEKELVEERERLRQELAKQRPAPRPDTGLPVEGYQRSDFMRDLKKVAKKQDRPSQPEQEGR
jgi:hypothetical protein